jgi:chromosome segregation ATPase
VSDGVRIDVYHHGVPVSDPKLDTVLEKLTMLIFQGGKIMATVQELSDELDAIKTAVDSVKATAAEQIAKIAELQAQIAAGSPVSQAQLDDLDAKADSILAALNPAPPTP